MTLLSSARPSRARVTAYIQCAYIHFFYGCARERIKCRATDCVRSRPSDLIFKSPFSSRPTKLINDRHAFYVLPTLTYTTRVLSVTGHRLPTYPKVSLNTRNIPFRARRATRVPRLLFSISSTSLTVRLVFERLSSPFRLFPYVNDTVVYTLVDVHILRNLPPSHSHYLFIYLQVCFVS